MSGEKIVARGIEEEMKTAYIDYSMSVIVSRALPDVRDGLKPVHRRVLYGMTELGLGASRPYKKSARIVGEVLGKYHPHGDSAVYDTMVRMAQEWSLRYPLVDGQGNFGSIDGDNPAAMRYTEARLRRIAEELLADLDKDTVDFRPNFDDSLKEPTVLPAKFPNLLVNGSSGIAVGMATNMAPHNLREVIAGVIAYIDNKEITITELAQLIKAPDFPTGGIIYGMEGVRNAFETGRGRVVIRSKSHFETTRTGRERVIITEIPYQTNKSKLLENIGRMINDKKLTGISDMRDESDRRGMRIVFDLKKDAIPEIVLNNLFKHTPLQSSFGVNNIALVKGRPMALNLKDQIRHYVDHRHEVVVRRTEYELKEAQKRAHILEGLLKALDHLDEVIALIRASRTPDMAREGLMTTFDFSEVQAKAILDMRLQRLTGLEREKLQAEYDELKKLIDYLESVLADEDLRMGIIKDELIEIDKRYGDERRSEISYTSADLSIEDMIPNEEVVITISHQGYMKRTNANEFRVQNRGGTGFKGAATKEEDFLEHLFISTTHNYMLFFTEMGRCYWKKVFEIPEGSRQSKGRAIQNLIQIPKEDKVKAYITVPNFKEKEFVDSHYIIMCTKKGIVKKTKLEAYSRPRVNGINAITIREDDELLEAKLVTDDDKIILAGRSGRAVLFDSSQAREMGRNSMGVRGIKLNEGDDEVVGMVVVEDKTEGVLLTVAENGYGKRSRIADYRETKRGAKGVKAMQITDKTGQLASIKEVKETNDIMIITRNGITIRMSVRDISLLGRATQGVRLIRLKGDDNIAAVAKVAEAEDEEEIVEGEEGTETSGENEATNAETTQSGEENDAASEEE